MAHQDVLVKFYGPPRVFDFPKLANRIFFEFIIIKLPLFFYIFPKLSSTEMSLLVANNSVALLSFVYSIK